MGDRPALADRLSHLSPHQREQAGATVVLCELVDELVTATREQSTLLRAVMVRLTADNAGQTRAGRTPAGPAPSGTPGGDDQGGAQVLLREPGVPAVDPDEEPAHDTSGRAVAEPTTPAKTGARTGAVKTTTPASPAKTAAAARRSTKKEG